MRLKRNIRSRLVSWQRYQLTLPRIQMSVILLLTGLVGFLSSFLLLHTGISRMWLRYPLAILAAYIAFLILLRLWLAIQRHQGDLDLNVNLDAPTQESFDGGGDFAGAGSGGSWEDSISPSSLNSNNSSFFDEIRFDIDLEEFGLLILAIVAIVGGLLASLYIVYAAPILLAEILVDGLLLGGLYKRVEHINRRHWLETAVRRTLLPALLCALLFGVGGWALQAIAPEAESIGEVWSILTSNNF